MLKNKKRGIILIAAYLVVLILFILGGAFVARSISEKRAAERAVDSAQAFYLAEAGINRAMDELRTDYFNWNTWAGAAIFHNLGNGQYRVEVQAVGNERIVTSTGLINNASREIETRVRRVIPAGFFDNALYVAEEIDLNGNAYTINGDIVYGNGPISGVIPGNINGTVTQDTTASPLPLLDFAQLRAWSQTQGNIYDADRLNDVKKGDDSFPTTFWLDPFDHNQGPNIVYLETDLELNGNIGTIGGFFVVDGDVVTNPGEWFDVTINGNGQIDGCIYTRGEFRINGGGGGLNVFGGVWASEEARMNGNATVEYNEEYMLAIESLNINPDVQITTWREVF